jgi:hypothetical protein
VRGQAGRQVTGMHGLRGQGIHVGATQSGIATIAPNVGV